MAVYEKQTWEAPSSVHEKVEEEMNSPSEKDLENGINHPKRLPYGTFVAARRLHRRLSLSSAEDDSSSRILKTFAAALLLVGTFSICSFLIVFVVLA